MWSRLATRIAVRHGQEFARHVIPAVAKPARTLWNEVIAFLFGCLGISFAFETWRFWKAYVKAPPADQFSDLVRLCISGFCTIVMLGYALSSYLRARKIARS